MVKNAVILAIIKRIRPLDPYLINSARGPKVARFAIHPTVSTRFTGGMLLLVDIVGQTVSVFPEFVLVINVVIQVLRPCQI